jgi:phage baseplate assembly protein W
MALYLGFAFPFQKGPTGFPAQASDNDLIQQSLVQLVMTGRGERIMRPDVGSNAYKFIFESTDLPLQNLIQTEVGNVIRKYEPRVILRGVEVTVNDATQQHPSLVTITINYIVVVTQVTDQVNITIAGP